MWTTIRFTLYFSSLRSGKLKSLRGSKKDSEVILKKYLHIPLSQIFTIFKSWYTSGQPFWPCRLEPICGTGTWSRSMVASPHADTALCTISSCWDSVVTDLACQCQREPDRAWGHITWPVVFLTGLEIWKRVWAGALIAWLPEIQQLICCHHLSNTAGRIHPPLSHCQISGPVRRLMN